MKNRKYYNDKKYGKLNYTEIKKIINENIENGRYEQKCIQDNVSPYFNEYAKTDVTKFCEKDAYADAYKTGLQHYMEYKGIPHDALGTETGIKSFLVSLDTRKFLNQHLSADSLRHFKGHIISKYTNVNNYHNIYVISLANDGTNITKAQI